MSFTPEQKERALEVLEECGGKMTLAIRKLGYPCRQTMYAWIRESDAAHVRTAGRPFSHYDPETKAEAVRLVQGGMDGKDVAKALGVLNAATVYNWARSAEREEPSTPAKPTVPEGSEHAWSGFEGTPEECIRQLELENDILRGVVEVLKAASLDALTNREKTLVIEHLRQTTGHALKDLTASLRISKSSYEYQRAALARPDKYAGLRSKIADIFEGASRSRGYRYVTHELRELEEPIVVSEKVVRRIMREEGMEVTRKRAGKPCSSYKGEITDAPENLVKRDFAAGLPNFLWLTDITEFAIPAGKSYLSPVLDCFDGALPAWSISSAPDDELSDSMLEKACAGLAPDEHPVIHSDRGCHYRWPGWIAICERNGLIRSMSAKGCSPDNSAMESLCAQAHNDSATALSWQLPVRPTESLTSCAAAHAASSALVYWLPRSLWNMAPPATYPREYAIPGAETTSPALMLSRSLQPTTMRVHRSITTARQLEPPVVLRQAMPATSFAVGTGHEKSRPMRSGRSGASGSGTVVLFEALGQMPRMPSSDMHFRTRQRVVPANPAYLSSSMSLDQTFRKPKRLPLSSHIAMMASLRAPQGSSPPPAPGHLQEPDLLTPSTRAIIETLQPTLSASMSRYLSCVRGSWRRRLPLFLGTRSRPRAPLCASSPRRAPSARPSSPGSPSRSPGA